MIKWVCFTHLPPSIGVWITLGKIFLFKVVRFGRLKQLRAAILRCFASAARRRFYIVLSVCRETQKSPAGSFDSLYITKKLLVDVRGSGGAFWTLSARRAAIENLSIDFCFRWTPYLHLRRKRNYNSSLNGSVIRTCIHFKLVKGRLNEYLSSSKSPDRTENRSNTVFRP